LQGRRRGAADFPRDLGRAGENAMSLRRRELLSAVIGFVLCFLAVAAGSYFWSSGVEDRIVERIGIEQGRALDRAAPRELAPESDHGEDSPAPQGDRAGPVGLAPPAAPAPGGTIAPA